jgi:hypothetical protein
LLPEENYDFTWAIIQIGWCVSGLKDEKKLLEIGDRAFDKYSHIHHGIEKSVRKRQAQKQRQK